ncbi:Membrane-anchored ubiquitin-fold protein 4 [Apostasia shenzhenica]|uniref:Membrane-anchored ubiquitin-fold protein 4 n=1 Tax=Apostasia shenzhenica TaxID=1088818 RepID=A0A2I0B7M5_9ASPA|nr:Membrane-anchored ubiquitin-fold protein 4 [Apostasia shenzhenica]
MPEEDLLELKFRLYDGSDIGPIWYAATFTVATLKDRIISEWPKGMSPINPSLLTMPPDMPSQIHFEPRKLVASPSLRYSLSTYGFTEGCERDNAMSHRLIGPTYGQTDMADEVGRWRGKAAMPRRPALLVRACTCRARIHGLL